MRKNGRFWEIVKRFLIDRALFALTIFFNQDVFYVFSSGRYAQGVKSSLKRHLRGQDGGKPLKIAIFSRFGPFFEVFSIFIENGSYDFY